jgi:hypothetical protein
MAVIGYLIAGVIILIVVLAITIYILLTRKVSSETLVSDQFSLSKNQSIVTADSFADPTTATDFLTSGKGTFQCFVYMDNLLRTTGYTECGTMPTQPSCSSGLYDPCPCDALADCTNCVHEGYRQLFNLYGVYRLEVLNVPDASRQNSVSAQLMVRTQAGTDAFMETVPLPPLELQKWTMITLSKNGRQVSVYYNNNLVSSSKMLNMITTMNPSGSIVQAGDSSGLSGTITLIRINGNTTENITDVGNYYSSHTDTRGNPSSLTTTPNEFSASIAPVKQSSMLSSMCLDGSCLHAPRIGGALPNLTTPTATAPSLYSVSTSYS